MFLAFKKAREEINNNKQARPKIEIAMMFMFSSYLRLKIRWSLILAKIK